MHELSIAQAIVAQIDAIKADRNIERVMAITVRIGSLSGVERHALEMAFPIALEAAGLEPLELRIESVPARVRCRDCGHEFSPDTLIFLCEQCEGINVDICAGRELEISALQVERNSD